MGRAKLPRKSTTIDMTAMCDVAFLLLSFFILTTKFKPAEAIAVTTPSSVSSKVAPNKDFVLVTIDKDGKVFDPFTGEEVSPAPIFVQDKSPILSEHIVQYRLKEDWFFDKERSVLDVRILGIAPVIYDATKEGGKYKELFWLYFPHCRFVFNNYFAYNDQNDAQWMSFDDLFWKRRFSSVMYKESNVYDRKIDTYKAGVDALFEAEKIKEEIRTLEHDVWSF